MIQTSKEARLQPLFVSAINAACANIDNALKYARQDMPLTVRLIVTKGGFEVTDEHHSVHCDFTKAAIFWFKMSNPAGKMKELKDRYIVLNEYTPHSALTESKDIALSLHVHSFVLLPEEEITGTKSPAKSIKVLAKEPEMESFITLLERAHFRKAISQKTIGPLPNLEDILSGTKTSVKAGVISPIIKMKLKLKSKKQKKKRREKKEKENKKESKKENEKKEKEEEQLIKFEDVDKIEGDMLADVDVILKEDAASKAEILAGSEGDAERKKELEKRTKDIKDKQLIDLLLTRGLLDRKRTPSKASPPKRGQLPEEIKKAVAALMEGKVKQGSPEKVTLAQIAKTEKPKAAGKRKKAEPGKKKAEAAPKKAAVEEGGKKVAAPKVKKEMPKRATRSTKEGKKKAGSK